MSAQNDSDDEAAWATVTHGYDEALQLDLSPETRGAMTRQRRLIAALAGVPQLAVAVTEERGAEVIPIDRRAE
jgi:hypothetical protein